MVLLLKKIFTFAMGNSFSVSNSEKLNEEQIAYVIRFWFKELNFYQFLEVSVL